MQNPYKFNHFLKICTATLTLMVFMGTSHLQAEPTNTLDLSRKNILDNAQTIQDDIEGLHQAGAISEILKTTAISTLAAITYGLIHDQITARACIEYYWTGNHTRYLDTDSPTLTGLLWGILSTWWMGAGLGATIGIFAQAGSWPRVSATELLSGFGVVFGGVALSTTLTGFGSLLGMNLVGYDPKWVKKNISGGKILKSAQQRRNWLAVGLSNSMGYRAGIIGATMMWGYILHRRYQQSLQSDYPSLSPPKKYSHAL